MHDSYEKDSWKSTFSILSLATGETCDQKGRFFHLSHVHECLQNLLKSVLHKTCCYTKALKRDVWDQSLATVLPELTDFG